MGDFNNYKLFKNVGIRSSDNKLIVMNVNKSNNVSFYSSDGGTNNIDVMSINSIINKSQNEDLNLSSLTGNKINPVITINNNHSDCRIMTNLNVNGNVNINNNLIIPTHSETSTLLANVQGSIYYNTSENMYEGYSNTEGWQPLGGFSKTKDATIHKNLNVLQNINCTDKITSNINLVKHNLIIPTHSETSSLLSNTLGSIYYNTTENMYEGYSNEGWQPLGGFSKTKDATIHKNLNVLGNLNITGNMNQINSTQITVNDKNIILASNNNADNHIEDGGLILQGATQKSILWKSANGWKSSEKITAPHLDTVANQLLIGNTQVGLNLNFSGNNLHINGNVPKAGQVLVGSGSEIKWANTDNSLINNQLIKVETGFNSTSVLNLNSGSPNYTRTYTAHSGYTLNQETKKIIIIVNFALYINFHSNLTSKVKLELFINNSTEPQHTIILQEMFSNRSYEYTKYFSVSKTAFTGASQIDLKFTDMNNSGNIKLFTNDNSTHKPPIITLQEIGDRTVKAIVDETRGSKTDQIAKVLVNTNANVTSTVLLNTPHTYNLHSSYTPSVNDNGTIIIIVNFTLYINFNSNLTSEVKLELLLNNNNSDNPVPQERTIILQEMFSNKNYEYTKYFSISKSDFGTDNSIQLKFTDINNSGNITLFTNDGTNVKKPKVTIQEIGSTTGWGTTIENIAIGQTTSADASFNKVIIKNNLDVSGNLNINKIAINGSFGNSGEVLKSTGQGLEWGTGGTEIDLSSSTGIGTRLISGKQLILGNSPISLNLNFSGNNLHINGNVPTAGQVLMSNGSEVKWANTDNSLIYNQLIKVVTETCDENQTTFSKIKQNSDIITLTGNTPQEKQITLSPYIVNNDTKKVIIIFNFSVYDTNLVSEIQIELLLGGADPASGNRKLIIKNMTGNQKNDYTKYFSLDSSDFSGGKNIKFKFTGLTNTGNIKIFTNDGTNFVSPVITLQEIGDRTIKAILNETRGSKTDQIAKVLVNTNANVSSPVLLNTPDPYELHNSYTPSVSDTGTIIIIVNFALYISFHSNLTSEVKLELLLNNGSDTNIPQERTITLKEMASNRSYEYTKYFSISKSAFGTDKKIELRFTDMNNSGNIKLFTNDNSTVKKPTVTIQEIGSTTGWGSAIDDIPIGQTTSADGSFNKMVVKHNLDVSGNVNIIGNGIINTSLGIGTTSLNNGFTGFNTHTNSILDINGQTTIRGHILPSQNAAFDLGNAEYKIRHLFLSDNSLWIGDEHKIDISSGKMKFKKRDKTKAPKKLNNEAITIEQVKSLLPAARKTEIGDDISKVKLSEWYNYADSIGIGTTIFTSNDTNMWAEDIEVGSSAWVKNGTAIYYDSGNVGIGVNPTEALEVNGKIKTNNQIISTISTGTAPFVVNSTTSVSNLRAGHTDTVYCWTSNSDQIYQIPFVRVYDGDGRGEPGDKSFYIDDDSSHLAYNPATATISGLAVPWSTISGGPSYAASTGILTATELTADKFNYGNTIYLQSHNTSYDGNHLSIYINGSRLYTFHPNGWFNYTGGADKHNTWSDDRMKIDEEDIGEMTSILMKLKPKKYKKYTNLTSLKDTNNPKNNCSFTERIDKTLIQDEFGLIAQQVYVEVPELRNLVVFSSDADQEKIKNTVLPPQGEEPANWYENYGWGSDDPTKFNYIQLISVLIKGFQEQEIEINTLKAENGELKSIIDKLKTANSFEEFKNNL